MVHKNHLESLLRHRFWGLDPKVCDSIGLAQDPKNFYSQVMLLLLVQGPHFEKHFGQQRERPQKILVLIIAFSALSFFFWGGGAALNTEKQRQ